MEMQCNYCKQQGWKGCCNVLDVKCKNYQEKIELVKGGQQGDYYWVDNRYQIYISDGCIYDTKGDYQKDDDIPQEIFEKRDLIMKLIGK